MTSKQIKKQSTNLLDAIEERKAREAMEKEELAKIPPGAVKAFSVVRKPGGWVMLTYTIVGGVITKTESTEPDLRILATEQFKIAAWRYWNAQ